MYPRFAISKIKSSSPGYVYTKNLYKILKIRPAQVCSVMNRRCSDFDDAPEPTSTPRGAKKRDSPSVVVSEATVSSKIKHPEPPFNYSKKKKKKTALERGRLREDLCSAEI